MRILHHFYSGFFRKLGYCVAALMFAGLLSLCSTEQARAQANTTCSPHMNSLNDNCDDEGQAFIAAMSAATERAQSAWSNGQGEPRVLAPNGQNIRVAACQVGSSFCIDTYNRTYPLGEACADRPDTYAGYTLQNSEYCDAGCVIKLDQNAPERYRIDAPRTNALFVGRGKYKATGAVCTVEKNSATDKPKRDPPKDDYCGVLEGGYKICLNSKGQKCITSPKSGRTFCGQGDTGMTGVTPDRTEGANISQSAPSPGLPNSPPNARQGEDWQKGAGGSVTNQTTNNTQNVTVYNNAGTPNTTPGSGTPGDGSDNPGTGGDGGDDGDDEGEKTQVSGGNECSSPPQCSGPEPYQCHIVNQLWLDRCQGLDGLNPDIDSAISRVNALESEWSNWTGGYSGNAWDEYVEGQHATADSIVGAEDLPLVDLDTSGFLGGETCPQLPSFTLEGTTVGLDMSEMCSLLSSLGLLVEALAYFLAIRILTGSGR